MFCERNDLSVEEVGETFHDSQSGVTVHQHCLVSDCHDSSWVCNWVCYECKNSSQQLLTDVKSRLRLEEEE